MELSGNITLETVRAYAETGADYVSSGAITHSRTAVDFNFRVELDAMTRASAQIHWFPVIGSTMQVAAELADRGLSKRHRRGRG